MYFNNGYQRRKFEQEQMKLRKEYKEAGMSEEAINEMYEFDLKVWRSNRRAIEHAAFPQEMMTEDRETGEMRYMDMDEFPANPYLRVAGAYDDPDGDWVYCMENDDLVEALLDLSTENRELVYRLWLGYSQAQVARKMGIKQPAVSRRLERIQKKLKKFASM